jgi:putative glycosyltransferase (TIGR04372 family)
VKLIVKRVLLLPALIALLLLRTVRRYVTVRLFVCNSSFLGHIALEPDTYLSSVSSHAAKRVIDVWSFGSRTVQANSVLVDLWRMKITVWPSWIVDRLIRAGEVFPALSLEVIPGDIFGSHLWDTSGPHLEIPGDVATRCAATLSGIGISSEARICCLIVRDDGYWSNDNQFNLSGEPRNRSISEFEVAARVIADAGYWVVRMGERVKGSLDVDHARVFDYANSSIQSKEMDIYLLSRCSFAFSSLTGPAAVALAFRRPVYYFDVTLIMQCFHGSQLVSWNPSEFIELASGRVLSLSQVMDDGIASFRTMNDFDSAGIAIRNHDASVLARFAAEAVAVSRGFWNGDMVLSAQQREAQKSLVRLCNQSGVESHAVKSVLSQCWLDDHPSDLGKQ